MWGKLPIPNYNGLHFLGFNLIKLSRPRPRSCFQEKNPMEIFNQIQIIFIYFIWYVKNFVIFETYKKG
jgi:hypothetical protein